MKRESVCLITHHLFHGTLFTTERKNIKDKI